MAEKTPSPAGEGWGEGNTKQENPLKSPSSQPSPSRESVARVQGLSYFTVGSNSIKWKLTKHLLYL
jgi:hypothetical protein